MYIHRSRVAKVSAIDDGIFKQPIYFPWSHTVSAQPPERQNVPPLHPYPLNLQRYKPSEIDPWYFPDIGNIPPPPLSNAHNVRYYASALLLTSSLHFRVCPLCTAVTSAFLSAGAGILVQPFCLSNPRILNLVTISPVSLVEGNWTVGH